MLGLGSGRTPPYRIYEVVGNLGSVWHTEQIRVKLRVCVGGCDEQIECLAKMRAAC